MSPEPRISLRIDHDDARILNADGIYQKVRFLEEEVTGSSWPQPFFILQYLLMKMGFFSNLQEQRDYLRKGKRDYQKAVVKELEEELDRHCSRFVRSGDLYGIQEEIDRHTERFKRFRSYADDATQRHWKRLRSETSDLDAWREKANEEFIRQEKDKFHSYFETVEANPLTERQKEAVIVDEANNLILAGAGSGKTSVVVAKIGYLLKQRYAAPDQILVLAYNKKAQMELAERIEEKLGVQVPTKTFHSLGLQIVAHDQRGKPSLCRWAEDERQMKPLVHSIVDELLQHSPDYFGILSRYFVSYFAPYKSEEDFENLGEYYAYLRNHDIRTFRGEKVKSFEECEIANQLFLWGIDYRYEEDYKYPTKTKEYRQYRPDFYLPDYDIYIEHFGISRDGKTRADIDNKRYLADMEWKRTLHREKGTCLLETYSYEKREGHLIESLKEKLLAEGVVLGERSIEEALQAFNESGKMDAFTKLFLTFMGHYKSNRLEIEELRGELKKEEYRGRAFLDLFEATCTEYERRKKECGCIDFDDMVTMAVETVEEGRFRSPYLYILIDEFQDISRGRSRLVAALRSQVERSSVTVVGDDWQSINRFAGSDIGIIRSFGELFGESETVQLDYTFRFPEEVSRVATGFIGKNPMQIPKTIQTVKRNDAPGIYCFWYSNGEEQSRRIDSILSLIDRNLKERKKKSVMFLGRYGFNKPENFALLQSRYEERLDLRYSTVHASKGLEADYIVLLSVEGGRYGFPSEIEDDPLLDLIMPQSEDFPNAEERRLFYVALTRTKNKVFLLTNKVSPSAFARELLEEHEGEVYHVGYDEQEIHRCPKCETGIPVKRKEERHWFYGCSNFPYCNYTEPIMLCPKCKEHEVRKDIAAHKAFCTDQECDGYIRLCKQCDNYMVLRNGKYGEFLGCRGYPECRYMENVGGYGSWVL